MRKHKIIILCLGTALLLSACAGGTGTVADGTYVKPVESSADKTEALTTAPSTTPMGAPATAPTKASTEASAQTPAVISTGLAPGEESPGESKTENPEPGETTEASPSESQEEPGPQSGSFEEADLVFHYKGSEFKPGDPFDYAQLEESWGTPRVERGMACIGSGYDENYYYGEDLAVYTLGEGDQQLIYDIYIAEEGFATARGAVIGQTSREELRDLYGEPHQSLGATDRYACGDTVVSFTFSGGILAEIDYNNTE